MQYLKFLLEKLSPAIDKMKKMPYKKASLVIALSASTLFLSANTILKDVKQPKIEWETKKIEIDMFQGTSRATEPFFISDKDLEDVELELVPELAKFGTIGLDEIQNIKAGDKNAVSLYFSISQDTKLGAYEGTLHLKQENKTIPQTLKIILNVTEPRADYIPDDISYPTADKIYEDVELGVAYVDDEILVSFNNNIDEVAIKQIVADIGGVFLGSIKEMNLYRVRIKNTGQLESIINELNNKSEVLMADYHWIFEEF